MAFFRSVEGKDEPRAGIEEYVGFLLKPKKGEFGDGDAGEGFLDGLSKRDDPVHGFLADSFAIVEKARFGEIGVDDVDFREFRVPRFAVDEDSVSSDPVVAVEFWKIGHEFRRPRGNHDLQSVGIQPFDLCLPDVFLHPDDRLRYVGRTREEDGHPVEFFYRFVGDVDVASRVHALDDDFRRGDPEIRRSESQVSRKR